MSLINPLQPGDKLGIIGGGQLGRLLALAARPFGLSIVIWDPDPIAPASGVADAHICNPYDNPDALRAFVGEIKRATYEFENIPFKVAQVLDGNNLLAPGAKALAISQDRLQEKRYLNQLGLKTAPYFDLSREEILAGLRDEWPGPSLLKTRRFGYDGKGQYPLATGEDFEKVLGKLDPDEFILESRIDFVREVSIILARASSGECRAFPLTENEHRGGILHRSAYPARVSDSLAREACLQTKILADSLDYIGVLAVEFFITSNNELLVNEFAPRVHNSGHWTMDGAPASQFEQHIRCVAGWPLASVEPCQQIEMINLIGNEVEEYGSYLANERDRLHLYGKAQVKPGRKMGHVNRFIG